MNDYDPIDRELDALLAEMNEHIRPAAGFQGWLWQRLARKLPRRRTNGAFTSGSSPNDQAAIREFVSPDGARTRSKESKEPMKRSKLLLVFSGVFVWLLVLVGAWAILPTDLTNLLIAAPPAVEPVGQDAPTPTPVLAPSTEFDGVGVPSASLFEALPRLYFYAYRTLIVNDNGQPVEEMRFFGNRRFLLVTKVAGGEIDRVVPGSATIQVDDLDATITRGLSGVARIDTTTLQDDIERAVLGELSGSDGLIGGERSYPAEFTYDDGLLLGFELEGVDYMLLTNLTEDQAIWVVRQMRQIVSGDQPQQAEAGPDGVVLTPTPTALPRPTGDPEQAAHLRYLTIQSALAQETYYGSLMTTGEIEGGDVVREARFYGNHRFFVLTEWPDGDPERLEGEPIEFGSYPAALAGGLTGTISLTQTHTLQDGTPILAGGGGGGGYGFDETREWPDAIDYENGLRLTWVADGVRYMALTNNSRDDLLAFADVVTRVATGQLPVTVPGYPDDFPLPFEPVEEEPPPQDQLAIFYIGSEGTFGVSMGALAFTPLHMHYLPPAATPQLGYPERSDAGDWVQLVVLSPDTGTMVIIHQSVDTGEGLPGEPNTTLDGVEGYLEENVSCTVDVPDYPAPIELGRSGGGGGGNADLLPRLTFDCVEPSARLTTIMDGVRVEVIVSGMDAEEAVQIVSGLYTAD
ncbi:MAG: hypothetical protein P8Z40_09860 [Chloroflexota bacterium]